MGESGTHAGPRQVHAFFITDQNDFQREQAKATEAAARRLGVRVTIRFAQSDALLQIHQLFESIHAKAGPAPDAIIVEPVAPQGMARVARNAAAAGIGWVTLNAAADYERELRQKHPDLAIFSVAVDNHRAGELLGAQALALLGESGLATVLSVQGPPDSQPALQRFDGLRQALAGRDIELASVDANWTQREARNLVADWLKLRKAAPHVVAAQNDEMAVGAREALGERLGPEVQRSIPTLGCDGLPAGGRALVDRGVLTGTLVTPMPAERAIEALASLFGSGERPAPEILTAPEPYPPLEKLEARRAGPGGGPAA